MGESKRKKKNELKASTNEKIPTNLKKQQAQSQYIIVASKMGNKFKWAGHKTFEKEKNQQKKDFKKLRYEMTSTLTMSSEHQKQEMQNNTK